MTKHYILSLDPSAKYEWDRCTLRDPITAEHPSLAGLVSEAVGEQPGCYLVAVNIEVKVLEQTVIDRQNALPPTIGESSRPPIAPLKELVA